MNCHILELTRLLASSTGYHDVDVEPMEPGRVKITAHGSGPKLHFSGKDLEDACRKLIESLCGGG